MALTDWLKDRWADVNVFDGGKSAASIRAAKQSPAPVQSAAKLPSASAPRQAAPARRIQVIKRPQQGIMDRVKDVFQADTQADQYRRQQSGRAIKYADQQAANPNDIAVPFRRPEVKVNENRNVRQKLWDQVNMADNGRTFKNATPTTSRSVLDQTRRNFNTGAAAVARSSAGTVQDLGGAYDLLTPGKGTNRVTQFGKDMGKDVDEFVDKKNYSTGGYKGMQVPHQVGTFLAVNALTGGAAAAARGTKVGSVAAKVTAPASRLISSRVTPALDDIVANGNRAQQLAVKAGRYVTDPQRMRNIGVDAIQNAGHRTSLDQDNNLGTAALDVGMSLGLQGGTELAGKAAQAGSRLVTTPLRNASLIRPVNLNADEAAALSRFQDARRGVYDMDETTYQRGIAAADKAGIDYRDAKAVDSVVGAMRDYETKKGTRKEDLMALKKRLDEKASIGMAAKPVDADGNPVSNFQPRPFSERGKPQRDPKIEEYADMLRSVGEGNGVDISPDGRRISNNYRTGETKGKRMTKQDWYEEAERQVKTGRADKAFMQYYKETAPRTDIDPELESLAATAPYSGKPVAKLPDKNTPREVPDFADPAVQFPAQKKSKFANTTVQNSDEVSDPLKKIVKEENVQYTPTTNKARIDAADEYLKTKSNDDAFTETIQRFENRKTVNDQDIVTGIQLAKKLDASGTEADLFKASELFDNLSRTLTEKGQAVQAASLLSARTPQGLLYTAQKNLRKNGVEVSPAVQKELKDLVDNVKRQTPGTYEDGLSRFKLMEYVAKKTPSSNASKAIQLWKAGLLSAPRTTAGNLAANTAETVLKKGFVDPLATGLDVLASVFTGKRSRSLTGKGIVSGFGEGVGKGVSYFKTGYDPRNPMEKFDVRDIHFSDTMKGRAAEKYTQTIFRLMGSQDQPFYYANLRNSLADQAITEAKNKGLKGDARNKFVKQFITEPDTKAMALADKEARYAVFQNETALGKAASRLKGAEGATGNVAEFVMPFSGVPSSVATRMIERTPIGTATEIVKQIRSKKFDQRAMTQAIANGTVVIPLLGVGKALADNSMITLGYPKDQTERDLWELEGKQPYSIKVGGKWRSMNYFQPAGTLIAAGAEYAQKIKDGGSPSEALAVAAAGGGKALTEQSFLKGVSGALGAITDPQTAGERFVEQTAGSAVPNVVRSAANATDRSKRDQDGVVDSFKAGIPGLRQSLPERNNIYGEAIPNVASAAEIGLDPTKPSNALGKDDPVTQELRRLKDVGQGLTTVKLTNTKDLKFTEDQKREFEKVTGQEVKKQWDAIVADPRYQELDDENRKKILRDAAETINGARKRQFMAANNIGEYSPTYTGKQAKLDTSQQRLLKGGSVDYLSKNDGDKTFAEDYEDKLAKFNEDQKDLTPVEKVKRQKELRQLKVKKDFDEDTVSLYGMSKAEAYDFLSSSDDGKAMANKMLAYGDALVKAGLAKTNKFRDSKGREAIKPKESGSGGGGGRGGSKRISAADFKLYTGGGVNPLALSSQLRKLLAEAKIG